jgi:hypothetical protein
MDTRLKNKNTEDTSASEATPRISAKKSGKENANSSDNSAKSVGFCVYLGPTIKGVIQGGAVFPGTKQEVIHSVPGICENQLIADLIVPGEQLVICREQVKTPGNLLYKKYQQLASGKKS